MNLRGPNHLVLSRRNLETLLKMLDRKTGICTLHRAIDDLGRVFRVSAEEDTEHYSSEERNPGDRGVMGIGPEDI